MNTNVNDFMPILFKVLFGFVIMNIIINFILLYIKNIRTYKLLAIFWPCVLVVFVAQSIFQTGELNIILAYSASCMTVTIASMIGFEVIGRSFPLKKYVLYFLATYPVTFLLYYYEVSFKALAIPFTFATGAPLIHTAFHILMSDRHKTTKLQKVYGIVCIAMAIHCINFALFRMEPGAQLWGWLVSYVIYDLFAVLLPSIVLENASMTENERLKKTVTQRTADLNQSLKENEGLTKILLHDVTNPLMVMRWYLQALKLENAENNDLISKVRKSHSALESLIQDVKDSYLKKNKTLNAVKLEECIDEIQFIFSPNLEQKHISLNFKNNLSPESRILAHRTSFTHNVLCNLVSNGLKFSPSNSEIEITASEDDKNIFVDIRDFGPGISEDVIEKLNRGEMLVSTTGTNGEKGTGLGLSIAKSMMRNFGGSIDFSKISTESGLLNKGSNVRITLNKSTTPLSLN